MKTINLLAAQADRINAALLAELISQGVRKMEPTDSYLSRGLDAIVSIAFWRQQYEWALRYEVNTVIPIALASLESTIARYKSSHFPPPEELLSQGEARISSFDR
jgi:hypothetical protein